MSVSTVSGTIQDPSGQVFANGTWQLVFKPTPNTPGLFTDGGVPFTTLFGGVLDNTGSFSQAGVARNDTIAPAGSKWTLVVSPNANGQAYSVDLNINNAAFSATALINAVVTNITVQATSLAHAYKDSEVVPAPVDGSAYFDTTLNVLKVWDAINGIWLSLTPGNGSPTFNNVTVTGQILVKNLENIRFADDFVLGSSSGGIIEAYADLPSTGGIIFLGLDINIASSQILTIIGGKPLVLECAGRTISFSHATGAGLTLTAANINNRDNVAFRNATLVNNGADNNTIGLKVSAITNVLIDNFNVKNFNSTGQTGILLDDVQDSKLHAVGFINNTIGLQAQNFSNNTVCDNCRFNGNVLGWRVLDTSGFAFTGETLTQSNTGPHGGEVLATSQNVTNFIYKDSWLEFNGDGTVNARHIYFNAALGMSIAGISIEDNTINPTNGAGKSFEFAGAGNFAYLYLKNNQGSFSFGSNVIATALSPVAGTVVIGQNEPTNYDVGINVGTTVDAMYGITMKPKGGASTKGYQIFAGFPGTFDGFLGIFDCTLGGLNQRILSYSTNNWDFPIGSVTFDNGGTLTGFSDAGITTKWKLNNTTGAMDIYNGVVGAGNKINYTVKQDDKTAQSATVGPITMVTGDTTTGGHYWILAVIECTVGDASGATVVVSETHTSDGIPLTVSSASLALSTATNASQRLQSFSNVDASTNITYTATVTGVPITAKFSVHVSVIKL